MRWAVQYVLEGVTAALRQDVHPELTGVRRRYYWWSNASVPFEADTRLVVPTDLIATHGFTNIDTWPLSARVWIAAWPPTIPKWPGYLLTAPKSRF
jgi:hypothetical protein